MTQPNFRALCAELVETFKDENTYTQRVEALDRARAALATPPPKPPTAIEIIDLSIKTDDAGLGIVEFARAALERWGHG